MRTLTSWKSYKFSHFETMKKKASLWKCTSLPTKCFFNWQLLVGGRQTKWTLMKMKEKKKIHRNAVQKILSLTSWNATKHFHRSHKIFFHSYFSCHLSHRNSTYNFSNQIINYPNISNYDEFTSTFIYRIEWMQKILTRWNSINDSFAPECMHNLLICFSHSAINSLLLPLCLHLQLSLLFLKRNRNIGANCVEIQYFERVSEWVMCIHINNLIVRLVLRWPSSLHSHLKIDTRTKTRCKMKFGSLSLLTEYVKAIKVIKWYEFKRLQGFSLYNLSAYSRCAMDSVLAHIGTRLCTALIA